MINRTLVGSWITFGLLFCLAVLVAYQFVEPAPPDRIVMATGGTDGAYHRFGLRLKEIVADSGVTIELKNTAGSAENLQLLSDGAVDIALVQGGLDSADQTVRALGSLFYEPVWVFHQLDSEPDEIRDLSGLRLGIGADGSGTQRLALELLSLNGVSSQNQRLSSSDAEESLLNGDIDAAFFVAGETAPYIQRMLENPDVKLMNIQRATSYRLHRRYLSHLVLPEGAVNLAANLPSGDRNLLAVAAMLVTRNDFHPALVDLFLIASQKALAQAGLFHEAGDFPRADFLSIPLDNEARRFHQRGPSLLQRFLPFWAATLIDRLIVMILPLLALLIPLGKAFPPIYRWRVRSRIYRWYDDLKAIEFDVANQATTGGELMKRIEALDDEVAQVETPLSYADELYHLRSHIELVRGRIQQRQSAMQ